MKLITVVGLAIALSAGAALAEGHKSSNASEKAEGKGLGVAEGVSVGGGAANVAQGVEKGGWGQVGGVAQGPKEKE